MWIGLGSTLRMPGSSTGGGPPRLGRALKRATRTWSGTAPRSCGTPWCRPPTRWYTNTSARRRQAHWERKLYEMEDRYEEVKRLGLADRYSARERNLHGLVFHEGIIDRELLAKEIDKVKKYIEDVEKIVQPAAQP